MVKISISSWTVTIGFPKNFCDLCKTIYRPLSKDTNSTKTQMLEKINHHNPQIGDWSSRFMDTICWFELIPPFGSSIRRCEALSWWICAYWDTISSNRLTVVINSAVHATTMQNRIMHWDVHWTMHDAIPQRFLVHCAQCKLPYIYIWRKVQYIYKLQNAA